MSEYSTITKLDLKYFVEI